VANYGCTVGFRPDGSKVQPFFFEAKNIKGEQK